MEPSMKGCRKKFRANSRRWVRGERVVTGMSDPFSLIGWNTWLILRDSMGAIIRAHGLLRLEAIAQEPGAAAHRAAAARWPWAGPAGVSQGATGRRAAVRAGAGHLVAAG